jgi:hypothetical protein
MSEIKLHRFEGRSIVVGSSDIKKNWLLMILVFEFLRFAHEHGAQKRKPFLRELLADFEREVTKQSQSKQPRLLRLKHLMDSRGIKIEPVSHSENYRISLNGRHQAKNLEGLVGEINDTLGSPNSNVFQESVQQLSEILRREVGGKIAKAMDAQLLMANSGSLINPSWKQKLELNPNDPNQKGAFDCLERVAGPFIDQEIEKVLTGPSTAKAS